MGLTRKARMLLLISVVIYLSGISCKPACTQTTPQELQAVSSEGQVNVGTGLLSKKQIFTIADAVARRHGWNPGKSDVRYDKPMAFFRSNRSLMSELEGHDWHVVAYATPGVVFGGKMLCVFVDGNTGKVLKIIDDQ